MSEEGTHFISENAGYEEANSAMRTNEIKSFRFTIVRYGSLFGSGAQKWNLIEKIISNSKKNKKTIYNGTSNDEREYINIKDAAEITVSLTEKKYDSKTFLISGNHRISIGVICKIIGETLNKKVKIKFLNKKNNLHFNYTPYNTDIENIDVQKIVKNTSRDSNFEIAKIIKKHKKQKSNQKKDVKKKIKCVEGRRGGEAPLRG